MKEGLLVWNVTLNSLMRSTFCANKSENVKKQRPAEPLPFAPMTLCVKWFV